LHILFWHTAPLIIERTTTWFKISGQSHNSLTIFIF
jgi:hypothetical protein